MPLRISKQQINYLILYFISKKLLSGTKMCLQSCIPTACYQAVKWLHAISKILFCSLHNKSNSQCKTFQKKRVF